MQWRCSLCALAFVAFFGMNFITEELRSDDGPREPSHSFNSLRAMPAAELFKGSYALRVNTSAVAPAVEFRGSARMTLGSQQTSVLGLQVSSISIFLEGAQEHIRSLAINDVAAPAADDIDLVLRGVEITDDGHLAASGLSPAFAGLRRKASSTEEGAVPAESSEPRSAALGTGGPENADYTDVDGARAAGRGGLRPCYVDALLMFPPGSQAAQRHKPLKEVEAVELVRHASGLSGHASSQDCGFSLSVTLRTIDVQHVGEKVLHYALWVAFLTMVQMACFISQMRYTDDGPSAARLSIIGITVQALMDAYDSFLHLSLTASSSYMFNTFAMISLSKFILFSLLEVRYVLTIWRCQNRDIFAAGWDEVRRHVSRFHSYFHGTLFAGLLVIFNFLEYLDILVLLIQAYWVPQIVHDVVHGSKASFQAKFLIGISVTRSLSLLYLWGCPSSIFSGDMYPTLPRAPNSKFCTAIVLIQLLQLTVMFTQQKFGPRWFVPRAFLPDVYNYQRVNVEVTDECVICMGELGSDGTQASAITPCDHAFHSACLERWMDIKMECPTCRAVLPPMS